MSQFLIWVWYETFPFKADFLVIFTHDQVSNLHVSMYMRLVVSKLR